MIQRIAFIYLFLLFAGTSSFGQEHYSSYFDEYSVKGSTTIYDYNNKRWIFTDSLDAHVETLPASTFKILNSLIALENKIIIDEHEVIKWDGTPNELFGKPYPIWDRDTDLKEAYKNSTIWFYVDLAEKIGRKKYKKIFNKIQYGNNNLTESGTDFWNYGNFGVSPKNQIELLIKLYEDELPFTNEHMETVKKIMISEKQNDTVFHDKTGWARKDGQNIGWWIGYMTTAHNVYFFATRIIDPIAVENPNFAASRKTITKRILDDYLNIKNQKKSNVSTHQ